jgi:hypothetical protein
MKKKLKREKEITDEKDQSINELTQQITVFKEKEATFLTS